jgi:hypothetical protein
VASKTSAANILKDSIATIENYIRKLKINQLHTSFTQYPLLKFKKE